MIIRQIGARTSAAQRKSAVIMRNEANSLLLASALQNASRISFLSTLPIEHESVFSTSTAAVLSTYKARSFSKNQDELILEYSHKPQTPVSLQMLMKTCSVNSPLSSPTAAAHHHHHHHGGRLGQLLAAQRVWMQQAEFLRKELPIRLSRRILDLQSVPSMRDMPSVQAVQRIYRDSFSQLVEYPPITNPQQEEGFASLLEMLYNNHSTVLVQMARGAYELRASLERQQQQDKKTNRKKARQQQSSFIFERMQECHAFLDRFYMSRIGIRVLAGQYLALRETSLALHDKNNDEDYVGMICLRTSPYHVVRQASEDAKRMCRNSYSRAPRVDIIGGKDLTFPYIPTYLHYILLELLKNSLRATCETHLGSLNLPPVTVIIADGHDNEDIVIKIADEGGGIRRSQLEQIKSYLYTTADPSIQDSFLLADDDGTTAAATSDASPIAGLGYGLPISKSYCQYFGGALDIMSMEGYGTDAFVYLKRLGDSEEPLPA